MAACFTDAPAGSEPGERGDETNETPSRSGLQAQEALATQFGVHPTQITEWTPHVLVRAGDVFGGTTSTSDTPDLTVLHAKIGPLALEHDC